MEGTDEASASSRARPTVMMPSASTLSSVASAALISRQAVPRSAGSSRVIRPGVIPLLRRVAAARARARTETWARVRHLLTDRRCAELDLLLVRDAYLGRTPLAWLGVGRRRRARPR